jgi:DNA-binding CsgD family transcriptional regulator
MPARLKDCVCLGYCKFFEVLLSVYLYFRVNIDNSNNNSKIDIDIHDYAKSEYNLNSHDIYIDDFKLIEHDGIISLIIYINSNNIILNKLFQTDDFKILDFMSKNWELNPDIIAEQLKLDPAEVNRVLRSAREGLGIGSARGLLFRLAAKNDRLPADKRLTDKQNEFLQLYFQGLSLSEIAGALGLAESSVASRKDNLTSALGAGNLAEAVNEVLRSAGELVSAESPQPGAVLLARLLGHRGGLGSGD